MDKTNHTKPWIVWGYGLAGFSRPLIAIASSWVGVLGIRMLDRVGKGLRSSPRDALLAASVPPERRGLAFGLHRSMDNAGAVLGPILAAILLGYGFKVRDLFVISIVPALMCLGMSSTNSRTKKACWLPLLAAVLAGIFRNYQPTLNVIFWL